MPHNVRACVRACTLVRLCLRAMTFTCREGVRVHGALVSPSAVVCMHRNLYGICLIVLFMMLFFVCVGRYTQHTMLKEGVFFTHLNRFGSTHRNCHPPFHQFHQTNYVFLAGISIKIDGRAYCRWTTGSGDSKKTHIGEETYLSERTYFLGDKTGTYTTSATSSCNNYRDCVIV